MNKFLVVMVVVIGLLFSGTVTFLAAEAGTLSKQVDVVCREHRVLAKIAKEEVDELILNNRSITPRLTLPGISHKELVELTEAKIHTKEFHVSQLETVRKATC